MIERLLETWLNKANERSFQIPFAQWLAYEGHTILHVSRHCSMEIGKDIVTIAPDGVPCAYQLKGVGGARMTLSMWREDLGKQLHALVHSKIVHPSLRTRKHHRSYIVINGDIDEEVQREIDDFNRASVDAGMHDRLVTTIVKGELFRDFKALEADFWATNLHDVKTYLEIFLDDGRGALPKEKLSKLFEDGLPFAHSKKPSRKLIARSLAGCSVICAAATSPYTTSANHVAEFEAWTLLWCYAAAIAERWQLAQKSVQFAIDVASEAMFTSLARLCDELKHRTEFSEGNPLTDRPVYRVRMTLILGLMGLYGLWMKERARKDGNSIDAIEVAFVERFCSEHGDKLELWGEYAIPQFLAWNWFRQTYIAGAATELFYGNLVEALSTLNAPGSPLPLPNAYYDAETILPGYFDPAKKPPEDSFDGRAHYLESLLHLFVRTNFKQRLKALFPSVTRIAFRSFQTAENERWKLLRYRNWNDGYDIERYMVPPHRWSALRNQAAECAGEELPKLVRPFPLHYLAMLLVMPYRVSSSGIRWLDTALETARVSGE